MIRSGAGGTHVERDDLFDRLGRLLDALEQIEARLRDGNLRPPTPEWYSVAEFAEAVGRTPLTVRRWCQDGRIQAQKKGSGRGPHRSWCIAHEELLRYQREGLRADEGKNGGESC